MVLALCFLPVNLRMPLYEFRCPNGHDFEKFYRSIGSAPAVESCPECQETAVRLMSAAGLVFKGSGFYITDYGKDGKKAEREAIAASSVKTGAAKSEGSNSEGSKAEAGKSESGSAAEAKPETKKSDTSKADKADSGAATTPAPKSESAGTATPKPATPAAKPSGTAKKS